jgi:PKD repeat protein
LKPSPLGSFRPSAYIEVTDLYDYNNGGTLVNAVDTARIYVFERWPEPKFYIDVKDDVDLRKNTFCSTSFGEDRFDKSEYVTKESNSPDAMRYDITYGVDPISAKIQDRSIARTWPMSSWTIHLTTNNALLGWPSNGYTIPIVSSLNLSIPKDQQSLFSTLSSMTFRYGDYGISMVVHSDVTNTSSDRIFFQEVKISEFEPFANFYAISGQSVKPSYITTDTPNAVSSDLQDINGYNGVTNIGNVLYPFISGYAPYFTVAFKDSSEAHTFPISSYHWNFGDAFNEGPEDITQPSSNYYTVTDVNLISGNFASGCWETDKQGHLASHTYIMPGTYDVTLTVNASCTETQDTCSKYISELDTGRKFYVYVKEIPPFCNDPIYASVDPLTGFTNAVGGVSGTSPVTVYFNASNIIAGSFPICRIDWDFGNGTVERITRYPTTEKTSQGLYTYNTSGFRYDKSDPRTVIVPHVYTNKTNSAQSFSINISTYACNTNSMVSCYKTDLVAPILPEISTAQIDTKKLIGSRFDDGGNLIYIVEGETNNTTYTVVLTGELNNV